MTMDPHSQMTYENTDVNSESEAGAVGYIDEEGIFISVKAYNKVINVFKCLYTPVFLAPLSAQAIETAALEEFGMRVAKLVYAEFVKYGQTDDIPKLRAIVTNLIGAAK